MKSKIVRIRKPAVSRAQAKELMWTYYREHRRLLPAWIREFREEILSGMMKGDGVQQTFDSILDNSGESMLPEADRRLAS